MAWKSPGIYYTEIDNTEYTNPAAEINTTVAIIGFAKKGPIGEPTEITSWTQFKSTFGSPISGEFAPIAVRNVLSNGGTVLFVRIADESVASSSAVVLKTETAATNGKLIFNRTAIPAAELKENGFYKANIKQSSTSNDSRLIYFRSPAEGYLSTYNLLEQLQASLGEYYGFTEYKYSIKTTPTSNEDNWRFFSLDFDNTVSFSDATETDSSIVGPYAVKLTTARATNGDSLAYGISQALSSGTVPYTEVEVKELRYFIKDSDTTGQIGLSVVGIDDEDAADYSQYDLENLLYFNTTTTDADTGDVTTLVNNLTYSQAISVGDQSLTVTYTVADGKLYLKDIVSALNKTLSSVNIAVKTVIDVDENNDFSVKLLFFVTNSGDGDKFNNKGVEANFLKFFGTDVAEDDYAFDTLSTNRPVELVLVGSNTFAARRGSSLPVTVDYNSDSNTIIFQLTEDESIADINGSIVKLADPGIGSYLSQTPVTDTDANAKYVEGNNKYAIGELVRTIPGVEASTFSIKKNSDGVVEIYTEGQLEHPLISENEDATITGESILSLFNSSAVDYSEDTSNLEVILYKDGTTAKDAGEYSRIGFVAKEYGEGTTDIGIEIYTSVSPLDETTQTHYVDLYVSGIKKESWEDVSYNPYDDNFIGTLINEDPMNGGSAYVTFVYDRGSSSSEELEIQDTINYTDTGIVYLGQALYDNSTAATNATNLSNVSTYDYAVGNNGVVSDSTALYLNALETENSPLSNKDLYSWFILITPDNISAEVQDQAVTLCEYMDDGIYIADPPEALTRKAVINWHNGRLGASDRVSALNSNFVCTYWPWVKIYDSTTSKYVWAPPSVVMAPQFVKVDNSYAPWYAPAGETNGLIATAIDIEESPNKTDRDALYLDQNRINPFLKLRNGNILAYGEKTCQRKNSTLTKIHTRRMLIALKKELRNSIKGYIFMPTMTENITEIKSKVTAIMESYKQGGGVDSYVVVCDGTNNTTETLQQDILNVDISCVPVGCLEQINISISLNKSAETSE